MKSALDIAQTAATVYDAFILQAEQRPRAPFLVVPPDPRRDYLPEGIAISYGEMLRVVRERARAFHQAGYGAGHRIVLMLDNRPEHHVNQLAIYAVGASIVPLSGDLTVDELAWILGHSEAALAIALPRHAERLRRAAARLGRPLPVVAPGTAPPSQSLVAGRTACGRDDEAALIYTSGTTGRPKGCIIDHEYHFAVGLNYAHHGGRIALNEGEERLFVPLPVFHVNAGINTLTTVILTGNCLILPDRFHPDLFWRQIEISRASAMHYLGIIPPLLLKRSVEEAERRHRLRFGLGAGIEPSLHAAFEKRFGLPMIEVWGMTETGRFLADCHEPRGVGTRAFGRACPGLLAEVHDEAGQPVEPGVPGELVVRDAGPDPRRGFFRGYFKDQAATQEAWRGGWFHSGDIVVADATGRLHFVERRKNIIRRSGENISAVEVENALIRHPAVAAVAVFAVRDELRDEEVMAAIVRAPGWSADAETARAIVLEARELLAYHKLPAWIAFVPDLPRTGTQKVRRGLIFPDHEDPRCAPGVIDLRALKKRQE